MSDSAVKVLYIAGWQRSGTTVIGNVMGSASSAVHIGELSFLWMKKHPSGFECGCGRVLWECVLWQPVLQRLGINRERRHEIGRLRRDSWHNKDVLTRYWEWRRRRVDLTYPGVLGEVYRMLADQSRTKVVVDSTKNSSDALAAALAPRVDLHLLHVVRDPRAAAYSGLHQKVHGTDSDGIPMKRFSPVRNTLHWNSRNLFIERCAAPAVAPGRYMRVRYEDLMASPRSQFMRIAEWVGMNPAELPFTNDSTLQARDSHTVMGNPNRHHSHGGLVLQPDNRWKQGLSDRDRWMATALGSPLMIRYGFPLRSKG